MKYTDKILHFVVMAAISATLFLAISPLVAFAISFIISVGKEIYDCFKKHPTGFDLYDLAADILGIFTGLLISMQIKL